MADRYLKLSCSWHDTSEWLQDLNPGARLAWIQALVYCKSKGIKGSVKAPALQQFARAENIPLKDINAMISAAVKDNALVVKDGDWIFTGWAKYQGEDETNAERQKRFREKNKDGKQSNTGHGVTASNGVSNANNTGHGVTASNGVSNANNTEEKRREEKKGNNPPTPHESVEGGEGDQGPVVRRSA